MQTFLNKMLDDYESGKISRRSLLAGITGMMLVPKARSGCSAIRAVSLNHVTIEVSDLARSRDFYTGVMALPVLHDYPAETPPSTYLGLGKSFLCIVPGKTVGVDHFCLGLPSYSANSVAKDLKAVGITVEIEDEQVYFRDPDGIRVQLAGADYSG